MAHYEIVLPEGLRLLVTVTSNPIDFDIAFPDRSRVNFHYVPGTPPLITHDANVQKTEVPTSGDRRVSMSPSATASPTVSYLMNADGTYPMVP